jgi:putative transposase
MKTPSSFYNPSKRTYPRRLPELEYPTTYQLRRVNEDGAFSWEGRRQFLSTVLKGQVVGLKHVADSTWELYFGPILLGLLDSAVPGLQAPPPIE